MRKMSCAGKAKDRYYTSGRNVTPSNDFGTNNQVFSTKNAKKASNQMNHTVTFDDDEEYLVNQIEEEQTFEEENLMNHMNDDSRGFGTQAFKGDHYDDTDDPEAEDLKG